MTEPILEELPTATQLASYRIIRLIGCGGFAYTYLVENNERQRFVLKELFPCGIMVRNHDGSIGLHSSQTEELEIWQSAVNNFCTEARVLRQINIPSIPQLVDTFQANNTYYIVQEWILGESLEKIGVNLPTNQREDKITFVEHLLHSLLDTLKAIHNEGILHRDIKPANIMIQDSDRSPILIDFGGVRLQIGGVTRNFNERIWSLGYSSPEQLSTQGIEQTQSSDLYSLAACFYFLLFNTKPPDCKQRLLNEPNHSFLELRDHYPEPLLISLDKAYQLDRQLRYANATQWLADLEERCLKSWFIGREPVMATKVVLEANNSLISRTHLEVRQYTNYYQLIDHSTNGCSLIHTDGRKEKIENSIKINNLAVAIDFAGSIYNLKQLLKHFN